MTYLTGWQAIATLLIGGVLAAAGVLLEHGSPLVPIGSSIVGAVLVLLHTQRNPQARTRAIDRERRPTSPGITPPPEALAPPWDPDKTPPPRTR